MEHPLSAFCLRAQRGLVGVAVAGSVLIVWPSPTDPYALPKATFVVMAAVLMAALMIVRAAVDRRPEVPVGIVPVAMLVVIACMTIATVASSTPLVSLLGPTRYTGLVPYLAYFVIAVGAMSAFRGVRLTPVLYAVLVAGTVQVAYGLVQSFGWQPLPFGSFATPIFGTLGNANFLSGWLGITAPVALWASLERSHGRSVRVVGGLVAFGAMAVIWRSESVQGLPAGAAGLFVVVVVWAITNPAGALSTYAKKARGLPRPALVGTVAGALVLVVLAALALLPLVWRQIGTGGAARLEYWSAARRLILDHPLIGTGPGTFVQRYAAYYEPMGTVTYELADDPHSVPLAMFTGGGVLVGSAYLAFVVLTGFVLVRGLRRSGGRERMVLGGLGGAWVAYQVQSLVSIDIPPLALTHWVLAALIAVAAGGLRFAFAVPDAKAEMRGRRRPRRSRPKPLPVGTKVAVGAAVVVAGLLLGFTTRPMRAVTATERVDDLISAGEPHEALGQARAAVELAPWDHRAWGELMRVAKGLGEHEEARRAAQRAVAMSPGTADYALSLASLEQRASNIDAALRWTRHAIEVEPRNVTVLATAARNLLVYGQGAEAEAVARQGLEVMETGDLWAVIGLRYTLDGQETKALEAYGRAIELDPEQEEAKAYFESRIPE